MVNTLQSADDIAKLILGHGINVVKAGNTRKNMGKSCSLVLAEALTEYGLLIEPLKETNEFIKQLQPKKGTKQ